MGGPPLGPPSIVERLRTEGRAGLRVSRGSVFAPGSQRDSLGPGVASWRPPLNGGVGHQHSRSVRTGRRDDRAVRRHDPQARGERARSRPRVSNTTSPSRLETACGWARSGIPRSTSKRSAAGSCRYSPRSGSVPASPRSSRFTTSSAANGANGPRGLNALAGRVVWRRLSAAPAVASAYGRRNAVCRSSVYGHHELGISCRSKRVFDHDVGLVGTRAVPVEEREAAGDQG